MAKVEEKQGDLLRSTSISSSDSGQCDGRKRRSPPELQVCIPHFYTLYSTLFDNPSLVRKSVPVFMYTLLLKLRNMIQLIIYRLLGGKHANHALYMTNCAESG